MTKFANFPLGVHGKELPKFQAQKGDDKHFWVFQTRFVKNPNVASARLLKQNNKLTAKNDEMYLADMQNGPNPID